VLFNELFFVFLQVSQVHHPLSNMIHKSSMFPIILKVKERIAKGLGATFPMVCDESIHYYE